MARLFKPEIQYLLDCLEDIDIKGYDAIHMIRHADVIDKLEEMLDEN